MGHVQGGGRLDLTVTGTGTYNETNKSFANTLLKNSYSYDSVGNITSINDSIWGETQTFGYDSLYRLTSAAAAGGLANYSETYQYDPSTGNLVNKNGLVLNYPAANGARPHAVTSAGSNTYGYDDNGNQTTRVIGGQTVTLGYDAENRLVSASGTNLTANFFYDGDGRRVKSTVNGETILFAGGHYEQKGNEISKYYFAGASRIAVRKYVIPQYSTLTYLAGDHLGSTSLAVDAVTGDVIQTRYKAWGEVRWTTPNKTLPTRFTFTGQYSHVSDEATDLGAAGFGLMFYNARWYDHYLNRFTQPDSIVPLASQGTQAWDRFSYVNNNPVRFTDSTGHWLDQGESGGDSESPDDCGTSENNGNDSSVPPPPIKTRAEWGAHNPGALGNGSEGQYPTNPNGYANYSDLSPGVSLDGILHTIVIHHEGNWQTYDVLQVQYDQMRAGYYDIAYHFIIGQDGTIYQGRDISVRGAHVEGANTGRIGVLWLGDFEPGMAFDNGFHLPFDPNGTDNAPTLPQLSSTVWLTMWLDSAYGIDSVVGHNDVNKTACPGANADPYIPLLDDIVTGK